MSRKLWIALGVAGVFGCGSCGVGLMLLGLAADPPATPAAAGGSNPPELVAFWSGGSDKLALYPDGKMKKWLRQSWQGGDSPVVCSITADFEGTWSATADQLTLNITEGRWRTCKGEQDFHPSSEQVTWRLQSTPGSYSTFGITLWMKPPDQSEGGLNKMCLDPDDCAKFMPGPY